MIGDSSHLPSEDPNFMMSIETPDMSYEPRIERSSFNFRNILKKLGMAAVAIGGGMIFVDAAAGYLTEASELSRMAYEGGIVAAVGGVALLAGSSSEKEA